MKKNTGNYKNQNKKNLKLPPPRPPQLSVSVPKCQLVRRHQHIDIKLTPDELKKYCSWVKANKISKWTLVAEATLMKQVHHIANAAARYTPCAVPDLITYYHAAAGYPIKATW